MANYFGAPGFTQSPARAGMSPVIAPQPAQVIRLGEMALWSTYLYADATALAGRQGDDVFKVALGSPGQGWANPLSIAETNLNQPGMISDGQAFNIYSIALHPYYSGGNSTASTFPIVAGDLRNIQNNLVLAWAFPQVNIDIAPAILIGSGGGIFGTSADTGAADGGGGSRIELNNGIGQVWVYQQNFVTLPTLVSFAIRLRWGANAVVVDGGSNASSLAIRVMLLGSYSQALQVG